MGLPIWVLVWSGRGALFQTSSSGRPFPDLVFWSSPWSARGAPPFPLVRAFSTALALGALGARDVLDAARNRCRGEGVTLNRLPALKNTIAGAGNVAGVLPSDDPWWGRSSEGSLADVVEWREWYRLLAERSLAIQEGESSTEFTKVRKTKMSSENITLRQEKCGYAVYF